MSRFAQIGEVAFLRGDLVASTAWFRSALTTLEGEGLERWKLSVRVYLNGSQILNSPFTEDGAKNLESARKALEPLASRLEKLHGGYCDLARAFAGLALVRLGQIQSVATGNADALRIVLTAPLEEFLESHPLKSAVESEPHATGNRIGPHGAVSALISLVTAEVLLRSGRTVKCQKHVRSIRKDFVHNAFTEVEADLLEAQAHIY